MTRLDEIKKRCEQATEGPWGATTRRGSWDWLIFLEDSPNLEICQMFHDGTDLNLTGESNSLFIAHSREDIPYLLSLVEKQAQELGEIKLAGRKMEEQYIYELANQANEYENDRDALLAKIREIRSLCLDPKEKDGCQTVASQVVRLCDVALKGEK